MKRISGVGVVLERKLHRVGVRTFQQIMNWSPADIEAIDTQLDFHGRVNREKWAAQARRLHKSSRKK